MEPNDAKSKKEVTPVNLMRTASCAESRFSSWKTVRLLIALVFCAASIATSGCKSSGCTGGCQQLDTNNPEKLAEVKTPDSDTVSRGQTSEVTDPTSPSEDSKDRHDKIFSEVRPGDQPGSTDSQAAVPASLASNDSSQIPIPAEKLGSTDASKLDSVEYVESTNNSVKESNIPNVMSAPVASVQTPSESSDAQKTNVATSESSTTSATQFQSVSPSSVQPNQGETVAHLDSTSSEPPVVSPDSEVKAESVKTTTEPPVEMSSGDAPTTFAPEEIKANGVGQQSETISDISERVDSAMATSSKEPAKTQTQEVPASVDASKEPEKTQTQEVPTPLDPKQDKSVPVTFKPTAFSRIIEVQTTGASEVVDSRGVSAQRSVKRAASGGGLITSGSPVGKPINASKDVAHTTRIQRR